MKEKVLGDGNVGAGTPMTKKKKSAFTLLYFMAKFPNWSTAAHWWASLSSFATEWGLGQMQRKDQSSVVSSLTGAAELIWSRK